MLTYLYVSPGVSMLQCDIDTPGTVALAPSVQKELVSNRLPSGLLRLIVFSLAPDTFQGHFAQVNAPVGLISGVVGANPDASDAGAIVRKISQVSGVSVSLDP